MTYTTSLSPLESRSMVQGWSHPVTDQLLIDGTARDLTGATVAIYFEDCHGKVRTPQGTVEITDAATGRVSYTPHVEDLMTDGSPLRQRWRVTEADGSVSFHPSGSPVRWYLWKN